jgi:hypothetical protein
MAKEYKRGSMDTTEQEKTFHGFVRTSAVVVAIVIMVLIFLAIVGT